MLKAFISAYPWDLIDNLDQALDRLHGELGIQGVHLWIAVPPVQQIRSRDIRPRILRDGGGLLFQPEGGVLRGTSWRPMIADWARTRDAVSAIVEGCAKRGVEVRLVVSLGEGGRTAAHHPESACVNALGAASTHSVCPFDAEVGGYWRAVMTELARRWGRRTLVLHDLGAAWTDHEYDRWTQPSGLGNVEKAVISVCFCESCCRVAGAVGVDVSAARQQAVDVINRWLNGAPPLFSISAALAAAPALSAYLACQWRALAEMVSRWAPLQTEIVVHRTMSPASLGFTATEAFWHTPAGVLTEIETPGALSSALCEGAKRNELLLAPSVCQDAGDAGLVALLQEVVRRGFCIVDVGNYGVMRESLFTPLRQAIRFARRTSSE